MREAVGGSLLLYLIIPIIILFICFIGFIMNYASAYRSANYIVSQIENCQGQFNDCAGMDMDQVFDDIQQKYSYVIPKKVSRNDLIPCYFKNGINTVFRVSLPVSFDLPIAGTVNFMYVKAETKSIPKVPDKSLALFKKKCSQ